MVMTNKRGKRQKIDDIRDGLDAAADTQVHGPGPVALVLLGFAFLIGFTLIAIIAGLGAMQALLVGWIGSLLCVILGAVWGALVDERAYARAIARDAASAARRKQAQVQAWDDDAAADAALEVEILDHDADLPARPGTMRDITPGLRRA